MPEQTAFVFAELHRSEWDSHVELSAVYKITSSASGKYIKVWLQYDFVWYLKSMLNSLVYASLTEMAVMFDMRPPDG